MRIVHEIESSMQCGISVRPYNCSPGKHGFNDLILSIVLAGEPDSLGQDEAIHLEGNSKYILDTLESLIESVRSVIDLSREELGPLRDTGCPEGCEHITINGNHKIDCPRHPNYEYFKKEEENAKQDSQS